MNGYQVIAKKFRPKKFSEVFEQEAIVQTLKNAICLKKLGHAYLFCGTRGTGKTTLVRLFAKAINCDNLSPDREPCNQCQSCTEVTLGSSLDVIEIDGASNRGIDDIRNLNETVGYAASNGKYKIYIIDEVHMLTKEAFSALLKTLEEPPPHVIFFFATTEPHKILSTILSRCQRFNLKRITPENIKAKLSLIAQQLNITIEDEALTVLARHAEGSLRDAEFLLDQLICFEPPPITQNHAITALGLIQPDFFFKLDQAAFKQDLAAAFSLSEALFQEGAHLQHVLESLTEHFRTLAKVQMGDAPPMPEYTTSAKIYSQHHVLEYLDYLIEALEKGHRTPFKQIHLEIVFLHIISNMKKIPLESLVERLEALKPEAPPLENLTPHKIKVPTPPPAVQTTLPPSPPTEIEQPLKPEEPPVFLTTPKPMLIANPSSTSNVKNLPLSIKEKIKHEQVMRFASVELNGSLKK